MRPGFTIDRRGSYAAAVASIEAVNTAPVPRPVIAAATLDRGAGDRTLDRAITEYFDAHPAVIAARRSMVRVGHESESCPGGHFGTAPCWAWHHNRLLYPDCYLIAYLARCIAAGETEEAARARLDAIRAPHRRGVTMMASSRPQTEPPVKDRSPF